MEPPDDASVLFQLKIRTIFDYYSNLTIRFPEIILQDFKEFNSIIFFKRNYGSH